VNLCLCSRPYSLNYHAGAMLVTVTYALQNSTVFKSAQNWVSVTDGSRTDNGSEFHRIGPETAKHLWPYLIVMERGTTRSPCAVERRWPRLADWDTGEHSSVRYVGAAWCRHLYTRTHTLYSILCWTGSQCSRSRTSVVMWSTSAYAVWFELQGWARSVEAGYWPRSHGGGHCYSSPPDS